MNAISFSLILTGVLLNAAAQLLLKAGTNVVGHFEFHADNIIPIGLKLAFQPLHHGRHGLLRESAWWSGSWRCRVFRCRSPTRCCPSAM
jgi:hypothetical protein